MLPPQRFGLRLLMVSGENTEPRDLDFPVACK